ARPPLGRESQQGGTGEKSGRKTKTTKSSSGSLLHKAPLVYPLTQILEALCRHAGRCSATCRCGVHCLRMLPALDQADRRRHGATAWRSGAARFWQISTKPVASRCPELRRHYQAEPVAAEKPVFRAAVSDVAYELLAGWVRSACQLTAFPELCLPLKARRLKRLAKDAVAGQLLSRLPSSPPSNHGSGQLDPTAAGHSAPLLGARRRRHPRGRPSETDAARSSAYYLRYRSMPREELARARPGDDQEW
uniref:RNA-directed DNA polymerase n=1 Tax=Macrostomum lignano TaxID=282301 RepID=A0A1I8F4L0_9PLAT